MSSLEIAFVCVIICTGMICVATAYLASSRHPNFAVYSGVTAGFGFAGAYILGGLV